MAEPARRFWTFDEFLAFDDGTHRHYELFEGQIVAMAPASDVHGALVARLAVRIDGGLRPPGEVVIKAGIVPPERADSWYQADLAVTCAGLTGQQLVAEPRLIVEVLSPSTAATDHEHKLPDYRTIPSLEDILVVSSSEPRIEHYQREADGWKIHDLHRGPRRALPPSDRERRRSRGHVAHGSAPEQLSAGGFRPAVLEALPLVRPRRDPGFEPGVDLGHHPPG